MSATPSAERESIDPQLPASLSVDQLRAIGDVIEAFFARGRFGHLPPHSIPFPWVLRWDFRGIPPNANGTMSIVDYDGQPVIVIDVRSTQPAHELRRTLAHEMKHAEDAETILSGHFDKDWLEHMADAVAARICSVIDDRLWLEERDRARTNAL